jgi:hypothetical protein
MPWHPLADRLDQLPLILAGPILRQVTPRSVTVWVALRKKADVILTVFDRDTTPGQTRLAAGSRPTVAVGKNLHIVAVTARATSPLSEGKVLFYDLRFATETGSPSLVRAMTRPSRLEEIERIAYAPPGLPPFKLPSFVLPPADLNNLRLVQGSCRKPNGGVKDTPRTKRRLTRWRCWTRS